MALQNAEKLDEQSLSSWRAWIEMLKGWFYMPAMSGRSPHGERGLKYVAPYRVDGLLQSLSSWRAWIEIVRRAVAYVAGQSLSSWRAWIEIPCRPTWAGGRSVALLMESVD